MLILGLKIRNFTQSVYIGTLGIAKKKKIKPFPYDPVETFRVTIRVKRTVYTVQVRDGFFKNNKIFASFRCNYNERREKQIRDVTIKQF